MKTIRNDKLIKRNSRIGGWAMALAVIILLGGFYVNIGNVSTDDLQSFYLILASFIIGFILVQVGLYLVNRYGGYPRVDEKLDAALKGLPGDFTIYHFMTPASHLLVGPAGIWILLPYRQRGVISYSKNRWRVSGGGFLQAYMTIFGQEGIGRPDLEAENEIRSVNTLLAKNFEGHEIPEVHAALVFTNENIVIQTEDAPLPAMKLKQLKDFMRKRAKQVKLPASLADKIKSAIEQ
ncbi:MAG: hypothetical protein AB1607_15760 [Chloroflexota bacterium]